MKHRGVTFATVYLAEAHAQDEWPIGSRKYGGINQATTMQQRSAVARRTVNEFKLPWSTFMDVLPDDRFSKVYGAWPTRFYVFSASQLVWVAEPKGCTFFVEELEKALEDCL